MKRKLTFLILFLASSIFYAQNKYAKIEAEKIGFITKKINLTPEQAQVFWPVYNQYKNEVVALVKSKKRIYKSTKLSQLTEQKATALLNENNVLEAKIHTKKMTFYQDLNTILTKRQILQLKIAEHHFKKRLLEKIKNRR